jgi:hypothetical protein
MRKSYKLPYIVLLAMLLLNVLVIGSTVVLHELGHYLMADFAGCRNIKLVLMDSRIGTYTEMSCPAEQSQYFAAIGALLLTTPVAIAFLLLRPMPERNIFWMIIGFNLTIMMLDVPGTAIWGYLTFGVGLLLFVIGEGMLIDNLFIYTERVQGLVGISEVEKAMGIFDEKKLRGFFRL